MSNETQPECPAHGYTAARAALRAILRAVMRRPGALYHPLYIGPVDSGDALEADIQSIAEAESLPVYFDYSKEIGKVLAAGMPALLVLPIHVVQDQIESVLQQMGRAQQLVLWGKESEDTLPDSLQRLFERGLAVDPAQLGRGLGNGWSMGPTLMRCAQDPGRLYNPVLLVAPSNRLPFVADEAALRLEAGGLSPVLTFTGFVHTDEPQVQRLAPGSAIVLRGVDVKNKDLRSAVEELIQRNIQIVLVAEPSFASVVRDDLEWSRVCKNAVTFVLNAPEIGTGSPREDSWPPLADVLVGPPRMGTEPERMMSGLLAKFPLPELLQTLGAGRHEGRMIVFSHEHLGTLDLAQGRLVAAWCLGAADDLDRLTRLRGHVSEQVRRDMLEHFACDMGRWVGAAFTFLQKECPLTDVSLPLDVLAMEVARRVDEAPRRMRRIGSLTAIWLARDSQPNVSAVAREVFLRMDGSRSLEKIAHELGLFTDEIIDAVLELISAEAIERVPDKGGDALTPIHEIAGQLLAWGLVSEAQRLLVTADQAGKLTPTAAMQLGHLLAFSDPQAAATAFRAASQDETLVLDGLLNASLLEVRGRQREAAAAWAEVRKLLKGAVLANARTVRHYAAMAELAARAGDFAFARSAVRSLRAGDAHARALAVSITRSGGFSL